MTIFEQEEDELEDDELQEEDEALKKANLILVVFSLSSPLWLCVKGKETQTPSEAEVYSDGWNAMKQRCKTLRKYFFGGKRK